MSRKANINMDILDDMQKNCLLEHFKNNKNIYILTKYNNKKVNVEYKIINIINNIMNIETTGVFYE